MGFKKDFSFKIKLCIISKKLQSFVKKLHYLFRFPDGLRAPCYLQRGDVVELPLPIASQWVFPLQAKNPGDGTNGF